MAPLKGIPAGHTRRAYVPLEPYPEAWDGVAHALDEASEASGWPEVAAFEHWNDPSRADLRPVQQRVDRLIGLKGPGRRPTVRHTRLAVRSAVAAHRFSGAPMVSHEEGAIAIVERLAHQREAPPLDVLFTLARALLPKPIVGTHAIPREGEALVFDGASSWEECCPPAEINDTVSGLLGMIQSVMRSPHHPVALAAWVYREVCKVHPLEDGNGRLARVVASAVLMSGGRSCLLLTPEENGVFVSCMSSAEGRCADALIPAVHEAVLRSERRLLA